MATTIGLMGFGRIGRNLFRILYKRDDIRLAAINDIADHKALEYLLRFDTILGPFPDEVSIQEGNLYVVGRQIPMLSEKDPGDVPWGDLGVDVVVHNWATNSTRTVLDWVEVIRTDEGLKEDLRNAEVVTIWLGWHDLIPSIGVIGKGGPCYKRGEIDLDCFRSVTDPMKQGFDDLLSEITSLANPNETLILIADTGNPFVDAWIEYGTLDTLKGPAYEEWRNHLMEAAENHGVHVVNTYHAINGPSGDQSLPSEYSQADGLHLSELGHKLLADLHREIGYEYSIP